MRIHVIRLSQEPELLLPQCTYPIREKKVLCIFVKSTFNSFKFVKSIYLEDEMVYVSLAQNEAVMWVETGDRGRFWGQRPSPHPRPVIIWTVQKRPRDISKESTDPQAATKDSTHLKASAKGIITDVHKFSLSSGAWCMYSSFPIKEKKCFVY